MSWIDLSGEIASEFAQLSGRADDQQRALETHAAKQAAYKRAWWAAMTHEQRLCYHRAWRAHRSPEQIAAEAARTKAYWAVPENKARKARLQKALRAERRKAR